MIYGILLESVRDGICSNYGNDIWKQIVEELCLEYESFSIHHQYNDNLIERIAECNQIYFSLKIKYDFLKRFR